LSGVYIDGPFIKSWLTQNNRALNAKKCLNLKERCVLPLSYLGVSDDLNYEEKICELWLGPTGDTIYHFHRAYPTDAHSSPMVGRPTYLRQEDIDPGFVFLFIRSNNPEWHPAIVYSVIEHFSWSTLYLGNGPTPRGVPFSDIPPRLNHLLKVLKSMQGKHHKVSLVVGVDYGNRFLAKVALGIGSILLRDSYNTSHLANLLRQFMWATSRKARSSVLIRGTGFLGKHSENLGEYLAWPGGHSVIILNIDNSLYLTTCFHEVQTATICISSEPVHWQGIIDDAGVIYVISPGLQKYVGPKDLPTYLAHKTEGDFSDPDLKALEDEMAEFRHPPPFDIQ